MSMVKEYYHLTKPGIIRGNLIHALAGVLLAHSYGLTWPPVLGVLSGIALVIASACVVNNYTDRQIDARMKRTKRRASVTGSIPLWNAMVFAGVLFIGGFSILAVYTNLIVGMIGVVAFVFYTIFYDIAKRHTVHSTLIGAVPGALPPLAGYVAISGMVDLPGFLLFLLILVWQMPHFYAISIFRRDDYKAAKLPVLGVQYGFPIVRRQIIAYTVLYLIAVSLLIASGVIGVVASMLLVTGSALWLLVVLKPVKGEEKWARSVFGTSLLLTLLLLLATGLNAGLASFAAVQ